ncbi:MAG: MmgE/PrpD family protein [Alphaproteobacteria bacterium]
MHDDGAAGAEFDDVVAWAATAPLPDEVARKARRLLLDSLGCVLSGLRHAEVAATAAALARWFPGTMRLPGCDVALAPAGIAALAASAMCWDEANEGLARAHGRPALSVVPVLLAAAPGLPLGRLLRGLVLGYELGARAGELWRIRPGMHVDGSWHALGAAAAAAWISGGDAARAARIAACQVPFSLYRPLAFGMTARNSYAAHAALLGILAAAAAEGGADAPRGGFAEARRLALLHEAAPARMPAGTWLLLEAYLKPYAGVRHAHYAAAAAIAARRGVARSEDIVAIRLETYAEALRYAANRAPAAPIAAQFSLSFGAASGLRFGDLSPDSYLAMADGELRRLEALVELAEEPALTAAGRRGARIVLRLADGGTREAEVGDVPGDPANPLPEPEVRAKFLRLAGHLPRAPAILARVLEGDDGAPLALDA